MALTFVSIDGHMPSLEGEVRRSTLQLDRTGNAPSLTVIGNLPHGYTFQPASVDDAMELIRYLAQWVTELE